MNIRDIRQKEAADSFKYRGLLKCCPRFGKIFTTIKILERENPSSILIIYPRVDIKNGWVSDFKKWGYKQSDRVIFQTAISAYKEINTHYDFIVLDELHEYSDKQLEDISKLFKTDTQVLGLSGTCTNKTLERIAYYTGLITCYDYPISKGVEEGILCDYKIYIHEVPLDSKKLLYSGKSEYKKFKTLEYVKEQTKLKKKPTFYFDLQLISIIQRSLAKRNKTIELLNKFKDDRILVFCGSTYIADGLGILSYHSGTKDKSILERFCNGWIQHMATIKMMQSGITVLPINKGIINYTTGNPEDTAQKICRFLGLEYDNPDKIAELHLISTTEIYEKKRLNTALMFFDKSKIIYI